MLFAINIVALLCLLTFVCLAFFNSIKKKTKSRSYYIKILISVTLIVFSAIIPTSCNNSSTAVNGTLDDNPSKTTSNDNITKVSGNLKLHFINVGQADSILIQDGNKSMLIDAGTNDEGKNVVNYIKSQGISKLDVVIGTHAHEDHIGGMDNVINSFEIGTIYLPKQQTTTKTYQDVLSAIRNKGLKITTPISGSTFKLNQAEVFILAPNNSSYQDINNSSIAIRLSYGDNHFMLMGDAENISENEILSKGYNITADLLKVGHHGSSSSTSQNFLNKVNPKYAIVMVGKGNSYGHPTKDTMDKLKAKSIELYRTDECGTIVATSDGKNISFNVKPGDYSYASLHSGSN